MRDVELPQGREQSTGNETGRFRVVFVKLFLGVSIMVKRMNACDVARDSSDELRPLTLLLTGPRPSTGATSSWPPAGLEETRVVEGVVRRVHAEDICLFAPFTADRAASVGREEEVHVRHELPRTLDLRPLVGQRVRVTVVSSRAGFDHLDRTLSISDDTGRVWLIARSGTVQGVTHALATGVDAPVLQAALSQRPAGPLVIGTAALQWLVPVGHSSLLELPGGAVLRATLVERRLDGTASYVIADARLFAEQAS